jgi:hypothetical protein
MTNDGRGSLQRIPAGKAANCGGLEREKNFIKRLNSAIALTLLEAVDRS